MYVPAVLDDKSISPVFASIIKPALLEKIPPTLKPLDKITFAIPSAVQYCV
jgi:hypothetical protein